VLKNGGLHDLTLIDVLGTPVGWTEWVAQHSEGAPSLHARVPVDGFAIAAEMVIHNVGICLLHDDLVGGSRLRARLVSPLDKPVDDQAGFYLLRPRDQSTSGAARAFYDWLRRERSTVPATRIEEPSLKLRPRAHHNRPAARRVRGERSSP
jgi:LysR family transcriptional regulator, glycine cleavage system transcriptional activator